MTFIKIKDIYNVKIDLFQINAVLLNFLFVKIFWRNGFTKILSSTAVFNGLE